MQNRPGSGETAGNEAATRAGADDGTGPLSSLRRRAVLGMAAAAGALAALPLSEGTATAAPASPAGGPAAKGAFARRFADPAAPVRPKFRWWWPDALVDSDEIEREIDQIAAAGFGGVEIAAVTHSLSEPVDPVRHGWGTRAWTDAVETALRRARKRDIVVDLTLGPAWPAAVPGITPDSPGAVKELAHGVTVLPAGGAYSGPLPEPVTAPGSGVTTRTLHRALAARVAAGASPTATPVQLDLDTVTDLTSRVPADGTLEWTAPDEGTWLVIACWERGSGQRPEGPAHTSPLSYVVDHFSAAGTRAVIDHWEEHILTSRMRALLRENGGALFEDSIEMETHATLWTPGIAAEFERRTGYALAPYLPALLQTKEKYVFAFDAVTNKAVRRDFMEVVTELYVENHLLPVQKWAHSLGLQLRIQPYGLQTDAMYKAAVLDISEGESLGFKNLDDFRTLAGGRDMGGKLILSNEAGGTAGGAYATTWDATLKKLVTQYAAGVNQAVFHGFAYASAPGAAWPGFAAFSPYNGGTGYGEAWGPRQPTWGHFPDIAGYLSRTQQVLQTGVNKVDVGVLWQKGYAGSGLGASWFTADGVPVGWTHLFLSPRLLDLPNAVVRNGVLAPDGPAYKALLVDGDVMIGREHTLQTDVAEKLLGYARKGLPIIVIGDWSDGHVPGMPRTGDNDRLLALIRKLLAQPTVSNVPDRPDVPQGIAALGLTRDVEYAEPSMLLHNHRADSDADYYFFANDAVSRKNSTGTRISHDVTLTTRHRDVVPYRLDAWTGTIEPLAAYTRLSDGRLRIRVTLEPGATTIIATARPGRWATGPAPQWHATATEAAEVRRAADGRPEIRDTRPGTYATTLGDGRTVTAVIDDVPEPVPLTRWTLTAEDWTPGATPSTTRRTRRTVELDGLVPWSEIPELADSSGIGRYRVTLGLGRPWTGGHGATLELGEVFDTYRVTVNGRHLPPADQVTTAVDVGPYLRRGTNTIEVEVATTLLNRLRVSNAPVFGVAQRQKYGLVGPVRLVPYGRAAAGR
ncbi:MULTISPECIES: glycosyl hydrolase [Streptomyces]|uniref:Glycosyl hydrolase n=1 Tax=Streptomyces glycanivorans TaxID=3033808 RepID=A0ABY9JF62_9ACTN|nr:MULTISPECIES: glycosyl hydrolase [unclassified Streptomyces]WLQ66393.1 glycosyl hydrolase [Streptomyces sp. Alt3]WSQ87224.1 glycosyl hydrolase [Streptomyces sp. NBC_01212]